MLLGLGGGHVGASLPAASSALTCTGTVRWVRRRTCCRIARAIQVGPSPARSVRPVLLQTGLLTLSVNLLYNLVLATVIVVPRPPRPTTNPGLVRGYGKRCAAHATLDKE